MKLRCLLFLICGFFFFSTVCYGYDSTGRVVSVVDGDTIKVLERNGSLTDIRFYGIDAPEKRQDFGPKARDMVSAMIAGKDVTFRIVDKDRYGRSVAYIYLNGVCINTAMVKSGYAWVYTKYCKDSICNKWSGYQKEAIQKKIGLWQQPNAIAPWDWRKNKEVADIVDNRLKAIEDSNAYTSSPGQNGATYGGDQHSGAKTQQVRSYTRKDGTVVRAYNRRPSR